MRDTMKPLRHAINGVVTGQITVGAITLPDYDEKVFTGESPALYIVYSTQQETPGPEENDCSMIVRSSIGIEIIRRSGSEVSKDDIDDASDQLYQILIPSYGTAGFTIPGFNISYAARESAITQNLAITETESILRKIIRFAFIITESN